MGHPGTKHTGANHRHVESLVGSHDWIVTNEKEAKCKAGMCGFISVVLKKVKDHLRLGYVA